MTTEQLETLRNELPGALKALVTFAAGTGCAKERYSG